MKEKLVIVYIINARLHLMIVKGYKDECIFDDPQLMEACIFVVNQE
jgi:hypothetical protein